MKIYTKTGDKGMTGLFSGDRVSKASAAIESYGTVDELNSWLGLCHSQCKDSELQKLFRLIQNDLHQLCADLATPVESGRKVDRIRSEQVVALEKSIDHFESELEPLTKFILAGGTELSATIHLARTVSRRAERRMVAYAESATVNSEAMIYMNRLSDLLFVLARVANRRAKVSDVFWESGRA